jgi:alpha-ketoglutaric semialdehyde dehydrogenase
MDFNLNMNTKILRIPNWINGKEVKPASGAWIEKFNPHSGELLSYLADSSRIDVKSAIESAGASFLEWSEFTPIMRGQILGKIVSLMKANSEELAKCVAIETGKPPQDAKGEVAAAILQGEYFAGEGMRLYGRSLTSGVPNKYSHTVRKPRGIAGLIVPANTPIANIAWKTFPALICGNSVVLKASEDSPKISHLFAKLTKKAGLPDGVLNVIQGNGSSAGAPIVENERISVISFTGSTTTGRWIAGVGGNRLACVSLELGGKNPLVVCDDADIDKAVHWASLSAFSNAGQRCASGSRIIIFEKVYEEFRDKFVKKANSLKIGIKEDCDLGPVINIKQYNNILNSIKGAEKEGGKILCGEKKSLNAKETKGYYIKPTIVEGLKPTAALSCEEIFGPVATLHSVKNIFGALELANSSQYGLTSAIHTRDVDRAMWFAQNVNAGVANINLGTFGSEPHMPFGGFGASGNGTREPGLEALDVYSELKNITFLTRRDLI